MKDMRTVMVAEEIFGHIRVSARRFRRNKVPVEQEEIELFPVWLAVGQTLKALIPSEGSRLKPGSNVAARVCSGRERALSYRHVFPLARERC